MTPSSRSIWDLFSSPLKARPSTPTAHGTTSCEAPRQRNCWAAVGSTCTEVPQLLESSGEQTKSQVLSAFVLQQLSVAIPSRFAYADWRLLYSTAIHGISLKTFYKRAAHCGCCILAIKDEAGNVFGAFCTEWREPSTPTSFYGSGETFLFSVEKLENLPPLPAGDSLAPPDEAVHLHRWSGANSFFMFSHRDHLAIGSGGHFGLWLDAELLHGSSGPSATFNNRCLCRHPSLKNDGCADHPEVGEFRCEVLEVWGVEHSAISRRNQEHLMRGLRPR